MQKVAHFRETVDYSAGSSLRLSILFPPLKTFKYIASLESSRQEMVSITASLVIEKGLEVCHSPVDGNYAHGLVLGKKTKSIAKFLANNCEVEIYPPNEV